MQVEKVMPKRLLVAIEGIDGSGKASQVAALRLHFEALGSSVTTFSFPVYDSVSGRLIDGFLKKRWRLEQPDIDLDVSSQLFQCCQLINRIEFTPEPLWRSDCEGTFIADRYHASAYAYGVAAGLDLDWLVRTHAHLPQPDVHIMLDIPIGESFRRRSARRDTYETDGPFLERVRGCYIDVFGRLGPAYQVIDGMGGSEDVTRRILDIIGRCQSM